MIDFSRYYPISGTETINGVFYSWDFIDRKEGILHYSTNHEPLSAVNLTQTTDDFMRHIQERALEQAKS
jgi:hypothetical protein